MSQYIYGRGELETYNTISGDQMNSITRIMRSTKGIYNIDDGVDTIYFDMEGNGAIDYGPLDIVKTKVLAMDVAFKVTVEEFATVADCGYHYDSKEEQDEDSRGTETKGTTEE